MIRFYYQILRGSGNNNRGLIHEVQAGEHVQGQLWGAFNGLFGPAANELLVVSALADDQEPVASPASVAAELWESTARPLDATPCAKQGLYVFRRFFVREQHVDEVVALSKQAWETFEGSADYAAEPQGLFRPQTDADGVVRLMLVTWYDGFESWETSRQPAPEAQENFQKRRDLTLSTYAVAARLVHS